MEKVDRVVALVGGIVLIAAVGLAALAPAAQTSPYHVVPRPADAQHAVPLGATNQVGEALQVEETFAVGNMSVHRLFVNVTLTPTGGFLSAGSMRVVLTAPNGTTHEAEAAVPQGASPVVMPLEIPVAPFPAAEVVDAGSQEARDAALARMRTLEGSGAWTVRFDYAPGPVPSPRAEASMLVHVVGWEPSGGAAPPPAAK